MSFFRKTRGSASPKVAYLSMEFALNAKIPNYAGGLGVLAADIMHSIADLNYPAVGVGLIYHQDEDSEKKFHPEYFMKKLPNTVKVRIEDRDVTVGAWQYDVTTKDGNTAPVYFLTTFCGDNEPWDREITRYLYPTSGYHRIAQEAILGIGGVKMLEELGFSKLKHYHLNEGHAAFSTLELLKQKNWDEDAVRDITRFTTHTPVPAGHDKFDYDLAYQVLGDQLPWNIRELATDGQLSMTHLALALSGRTNGVSKKHQLVCFDMFPGHSFEGITNGVHLTRWASPATAECLDAHLPKWRSDPSVMENAPKKIPTAALKNMRAANKARLLDWVNDNPNFFHFEGDLKKSDLLDKDRLTIVFARRFVPYKRPLLIFRDLERLKKIGHKKIQFVFAGHCHPDDYFCNNRKETLRSFAKELRGSIKIAVVPDYNIDIAEKLVSGANIWLNNPIPPREASGTSGMKAALNGAMNLSVLDGWWIEGLKQKPKSGWGFGKEVDPNWSDDERDDIQAAELYDELEKAVELFTKQPDKWLEGVAQSMSLAGHFNTHRVVEEYDEKMWSD